MRIQTTTMRKSYEVVIFYVTDGEDWYRYLMDLLKRNNETKVKALDLDQMDYENPPEVKEAIRETCLVVLLSSPGLQAYMKDKTWLSESLCNLPGNTTVSVALCFEDGEEFIKSIQDEYPGSSEWHHFSFSQDAKENLRVVANMLEEVDKNAPLTDVRPKAKTKSKRVSGISVRVIPSRVHSSNSDVVLAFKDEIKGTVQVRLRSKHGGSPDTPTDTKKLNPYTYKFKTPDKAPGDYTIHIFQDAREIDKKPFYYEAPHEVAFSSVWYLCQTFQCKDLSELDGKLVDIIERTLPEDDSMSALFARLKAGLNTGVQRSKCEFPTILHFAAANGLSEFCSLLLEVPCSQTAFQIENNDGKDPADLAEINKHPELAQYIRDFMATKYVADACDLYIEMSQGYRNVEHEPETESDYIDMGRTKNRALSLPQSADDDQEGLYTTANPKSPPLLPRATAAKSLPPVPKVKPRKPSDQVNRQESEDGCPKYRAPPPPPSTLSRTQSQRSPSPSIDHQSVERKVSTLPPNLSASFMMKSVECDLPTTAMGSTSQNELLDIMQGVKEGNFTQQQASMLFNSWQERNGDGQTKSFKDRQKNLKKMREAYSSMITTVEQSAEPGVPSRTSFFSRLISKRKKPQHHIPLISSPVPEGGTLRNSRVSAVSRGQRLSNISNISSSSSSSRESTASTGNDHYGSSDDSERQSRKLDFLAETENMEVPPPVPKRTHTRTDVTRPPPIPKR